MLPGFSWPKAADKVERKLVNDVKTHGWHVLGVFDGTGGAPRPDFCYSVGLYLSYGHPEIVLMGLPIETAHRIINNVGEFAKSGNQIVPNQRHDEFIEGYDAIFQPVSVRRYRDYLGYGMWFYRSLLKPFPALQLVWPDRSGRFPWDEGVNHNCVSRQHPLWEG